MNPIINLFYLCHFILQSVVASVDSESKVRQIKLSSNCFSPFKHSLLNGCLTRVNFKGPVVLLTHFFFNLNFINFNSKNVPPIKENRK
jgi:hypothetical protein